MTFQELLDFVQKAELPVIWMCRKEDLEGSHFDTRQLNHIVWSDVDELREKLKNRILATIGRGPVRRIE
jgi:hypothetical protein